MEDDQVYHLSADDIGERNNARLSPSTDKLRLPAATKYEVNRGYTIESIAETCETEVDIVLEANTNLSNAEEIDNVEAVDILA